MAFSAHIHRLLFAVLIALLALGTGAVSASAATKIKQANAVDADSDGSVDGFDVTFSAKVLRGKGKASSRAFSVSGFRVTSVAKPRGKRVRVRVAEGAACDVGARPKISYRGGMLTNSRKRRLRRSRIDLGRKDRRRPRISCAVTRDSDADGHLDTLTITWSRPVRSPASSGAGQFGVDRYTVASVSAARGRFVTLKLREKASFDTGAVPAVFYRKPKRGVRGVRATARRRGSAASTTYNDTRDKAVAQLQSARTEDANLNGFVDSVVARFSEAVKADPAAIGVAGARVTGVAKRGRDGFAAALAEGPLRADARPDVSFGTARKVVRDLAGNVAPRRSAQADDGAAPVIVAARTLDRGGIGGRLDTLSLTWSEPVAHTPDFDGAYPFGVTGYSIASASGTSGAMLDLWLIEGSTPDSGARPPVGYTRGAGAPVRDVAGNEAASHTFSAIADAVPPRLLAATTQDGDADGRLDLVRFDFTEPVSSPQRGCASGCGFSIPSLPPVTALAGAGSSVTVTLTEGALNGGVKPVTSYQPLAGGAVRDLAGNAAPAASGLTAADGAAPVALDAYTVDSDTNGHIDEVRVGFSEALSYPGDAVGQTSFTATGYTVDTVDPASGSNLVLNLEESVVPDTGSAPAVGYTGSGGVALRDVNGVEHVRRTWPSLTRDNASPVFVGARTADLNGGPGDEVGKLDAVELVYSETIEGTPQASFFQVDGSQPDDVLLGADSVQLLVAEGPDYDTDATKAVSYTPGDLHDEAEGPGDTTDPAPAASTTADDGVGPAIVAAETVDSEGSPNGVVDGVKLTFSEPVTHVDGPSPAIGLTDPDLTVSAASAGATTEELVLTVQQALSPNGGAKPQITVTAPDRVPDGVGNGALQTPFTAVADKVAPVLVDARFGEVASGICAAGAGGGQDCVRATWSEPVSAPADSSGLSLSSPFAVGDMLTFAAGPHVDALAAGDPDRDSTGEVTYTPGGSGDVSDLAGNASLGPATIEVGPACEDPGQEPNDSQLPSNPLLSSSQVYTERVCAHDEDWFRVIVSGGRASIYVDPSPLLATSVRLFNGAGVQVALAPTNGLGAADWIDLQTPDGEYWVQVSAPGSQEGAYCIDPNLLASDTPCSGDEPVDQ